MKRLLAFVLVLTVILGTVVIPAWANTTDVSTGSLYAIPNDATQVELGDEAYTVLRNLDDVKAAFPTTSVKMDQKYILAADIDCTGTTFEGGDLLIPSGTVLEGNGFGFINVNEKDGLLSFQIGKEIVFRNLHFGTKNNPIVIRTDSQDDNGNLAAICDRPKGTTRWENCQFYTGVYCPAGGNNAGVFGHASGKHTFIDCVVDAHVENGTGGGDHGLLVSRCSGGGVELILKGVDFYGYLDSTNNGGAIMGWFAGLLTAENCNNYATIRASTAGGFIGNSANNQFSYSFENCVNYGTITCTTSAAKTHTGGFVGQQRYRYATFENCVNLGSISDGVYTGGFVGEAGGLFTAINCLNAGKITGGAEHTGGIAGWGQANLIGCINVGQIIGGVSAGNMLGKATIATVTNCYGLGKTSNGATGAINGVENPNATTASGNKYLGTLDFGAYIGVTEDTDAITQEEAMAVLEEMHSQYVFIAENDGTISLNQTHLRAVQNTAAADGKFSVRILGTVVSLSQKEVGFKGTVSYTENGTPKTKDVTIENSGTSAVHKAILAGQSVVTAEDLMGTYIYTMKLENLPATGEITIKLAPVSVIAGETEDTVIEGTTITLIYNDGAFVGTEGAEAGTIITLPTYTDDGNVDTPELKPDADKDHPYDIPETATTYKIDGVEYKVIRTFEDWEKALSGRVVKEVVGSGFFQTTIEHIYPDTVHLILADTLDGEGKTIAPEAWLLGGGSVIEGNGYSVVNYNGYNVFKIVPAIKAEDNKTEVFDKVVVKNIDFGCKDLGILGVAVSLPDANKNVGLISATTEIPTEWNNCNVYGDLYTTANSAFAGAWFGSVKGNHSFTNCSYTGLTVSTDYGAGFIGNVNDSDSVITIDNCANYGEIWSEGYGAGFIAITVQASANGKVIITNSKNYGDIKCLMYISGFIAESKTNLQIENSANYGNIYGGSLYATGIGGFVARMLNTGNGEMSTKITNCVNYGSITGRGTAAGGIIGVIGENGQKRKNPVELEKIANFGTISAGTAGGGIVGIHYETGLMVTDALNAGEVSGADASGIVAMITKGTEVNLEVCANIGKITQIYSQTYNGGIGNIGGMVTAMPAEGAVPAGEIAIKQCYAFGKLVPWEGSEATGILVAIGSIITENPDENSYVDCSDFEVTEDMLIGIDIVEPYTLQEAATKLAEIYTDYTFEVVEGAIVAAPVQNG